MPVAGHSPTNFSNDVFITITVNVGKGDSMSFVQFPGAGRRGDVHERLAFLVAK